MSIIRKAPFGHVVTAFLQSSSCRRGSVRLVFALALTFALAACDDDESSFVRPGDDSSSSVCEDCDDASSSSVRSSSSAEPALSSAEGGEDLSSSSARSSSSAPVEDLSSSSSAKSSSSVRSSSSAPVEDLSSSSAKSSSSVSSSSAKSSSSFLRKDYTSANHSYSELEDPRDHRVYKYLTIRGENKNGERDSVTVMAENLNVGIMVQGAEDQTDETKIEKYCYDNDTLNCYQYGGLYQWAEAMQLPSECNAKSCADQIKPNHRGICPEGWRLLTYDDFYIVVHADGNDAGVKGVRAMGFGGHNYNGYSLIGGGMREGDDSLFYKLNAAAFWYFPIEQESRVNRAGSGSTNSSTTSFSQGYNSKNDGFSVRCVMAE